MTNAIHGVTANTQNRMLIDAGAVFVGDYTNSANLLGATKGGNVFEINRTIKDIRPDGAMGPVKGFRRREEIVAKLTVKNLEITEANLLKALPGAAASSHVITGAAIDDADFIADVYLVGTISDPSFPGTTKPIVLHLTNCLVDGPFNLSLNPKEEAVMTMVFTAHFVSTDLTTEPWSITYPS
jgi:hypothetical protein